LLFCILPVLLLPFGQQGYSDRLLTTTLIQLHAKPNESGDRVPVASKAGTDLFYHPDFQRSYLLIPEPDPFWPTFYVRRDAAEWLMPP